MFCPVICKVCSSRRRINSAVFGVKMPHFLSFSFMCRKVLPVVAHLVSLEPWQRAVTGRVGAAATALTAGLLGSLLTYTLLPLPVCFGNSSFWPSGFFSCVGRSVCPAILKGKKKKNQFTGCHLFFSGLTNALWFHQQCFCKELALYPRDALWCQQSPSGTNSKKSTRCM